jgi:Effector Associated Constant Component 1
MNEVRLHVAGYTDSDAEERADLAAGLREELAEGVADEISHPSIQPPPGTKGGALEWAQLLVTMSGTLPPLIMAVQGWLGRHRGAAVTLEVDGDKLTLGEASEVEQRRLVEAFLARHGGGG